MREVRLCTPPIIARFTRNRAELMALVPKGPDLLGDTANRNRSKATPLQTQFIADSRCVDCDLFDELSFEAQHTTGSHDRWGAHSTTPYSYTCS